MDAFRAAVSTSMSTPVASVNIDEDVHLAYEQMRRLRASAIVVTGRDGKAVGVVSRRSLLRAGRVLNRARGRETIALLDLPRLASGDVMTRPVVGLSPDASVTDACRLLVAKHVHRVFVLAEDIAVGVFSTKEVMAAVLASRLATPLAGMMSKPMVAVETTATIAAAVEAMEVARVGGVVVTEDGDPVGLFTEVEAVEARDRAPSTPVEEVMNQQLIRLPDTMPLFRAAGLALATHARRIVVFSEARPTGVLTGIDFARAVIDAA